MTVYTLSDYTLTGAAISVAAIAAAQSVACGGAAKWVQWTATAVASAAAPIRAGANAGASRGTPMYGASDGVFWPPVAETTSSYSLDNATVYGAAGDIVSISYAL